MESPNTILVATDYSDNAQNAFHFACGIAQDIGAEIKVVHIASPLLVPVEALNENKPSPMERFVQNMPQGDIHLLPAVETEVRAGLSVAAELEKLTKDPSVLMLVMGTQGSHNIIEKLLGSISSKVAQRAHCPVLLIPPQQAYHSFENVLYASNYESADHEMLERIIDFTRFFKANIHFVNVQQKAERSERVENIIFNQLFEKGDPDFCFNLLQLNEEDVISSLNQYARENEIDLVVIVNRQRSFLERLFQQSTTQEMALHTTLPLMVFHIG